VVDVGVASIGDLAATSFGFAPDEKAAPFSFVSSAGLSADPVVPCSFHFG